MAIDQNTSFIAITIIIEMIYMWSASSVIMYYVLYIMDCNEMEKKKKKNIVVYNIGLYQLKADVVMLNTVKNNVPGVPRVSPSTE